MQRFELGPRCGVQLGLEAILRQRLAGDGIEISHAAPGRFIETQRRTQGIFAWQDQRQDHRRSMDSSTASSRQLNGKFNGKFRRELLRHRTDRSYRLSDAQWPA